MMKKIVMGLVAGLALGGLAQPPDVPIWPEGKIPGPQTNVVNYAPFYRWWAPAELKLDSILICCSGGGYMSSVVNNCETAPLVKYFNAKGMTVVEFRYRSPRLDPKIGPKHLLAWQDAQRLVRIVRHEAKKRGLDPDKIGFTGGSAGGHLAVMMGVSSTTNAYELLGDEIDREPCNVNFSVPVYPAYGILDPKAGRNVDNAVPGTDLSLPIVPEFLFDAQTPPMCFFHGGDDPWTPMTSVRCWHRLKTMGIPAELHVIALGSHVFQFGVHDESSAAKWKEDFWGWLHRMDFATRHPPIWKKDWKGGVWKKPVKVSDTVYELPEKCTVDFTVFILGKSTSMRFGPTELQLPADKGLKAWKFQRVTVTVDGDRLGGFAESRPIPAEWIRPNAKFKEDGRRICFDKAALQVTDLRLIER